MHQILGVQALGFPDGWARVSAFGGVIALGIVNAAGECRASVTEAIYGRKAHQIPCEQRPTPAEVQRVIEQHPRVSRIEAVNPGGVGLTVNTHSWPGKSDPMIWYSTVRDREAVEALLDDETYFFGIPYRLINT